MLCSLWDLSSLSRDFSRITAAKVLSPNQWTTREFPGKMFLIHAHTEEIVYEMQNWDFPGRLMVDVVVHRTLEVQGFLVSAS